MFFFFKQKTAYEISACLVGSEMCIRDRIGVVAEEHAQEDGRVAGHGHLSMLERLAPAAAALVELHAPAVRRVVRVAASDEVADGARLLLSRLERLPDDLLQARRGLGH